MIVVKPYADQTIWGGNRLAPFNDVHRDRIGHLYSVNCNDYIGNTILNGLFAGKTVDEYFYTVRERFGLGRYRHFPLVIALVDAKENLSIQVHPDDDTARLLSGGSFSGKCESWYFMEVPVSGTIFAGCNCSDLEEVRMAVLNHRMEDVTARTSVNRGDYVFVQSGTLHALSAGSLVYEIEENAGCTYRFYDFERRDERGMRRELHIPQALFSVKPENCIVPRRYGKEPIEERLYSTQFVSEREWYANESGMLQVCTVLRGEGIADGIRIQKGCSVILEPEESVEVAGMDVMIAQPFSEKKE